MLGELFSRIREGIEYVSLETVILAEEETAGETSLIAAQEPVDFPVSMLFDGQ
jgi:hypothetical protein